MGLFIGRILLIVSVQQHPSLPLMMEALVQCKTTDNALHRKVYKSAPLSIRQNGLAFFFETQMKAVFAVVSEGKYQTSLQAQFSDAKFILCIRFYNTVGSGNVFIG